MKYIRQLLFLPILLLVLFTACRKSSSANWDVDAVSPVVNSVLNIKNFISDTLFQADQTGLLHLKVNRELASLKLDSLVDLPATTFTASFKYPLPFDQILLPGQAIPTPVSDLNFDLSDGIALKTIVIRNGSIKVQMTNDLTQPLDIIYTLPSVKKDGAALTIHETIPPAPAVLVKSYDLAGYNFDLTGASGVGFNTLVQTCSLTLSPSASSVVLHQNEGAFVKINYENTEAQFVEGFFGQQDVEIAADTADLALLENFKASNFLLSDATMDFTLLNEFGVDFKGSISNVVAINTKDNKAVTLTGTQLNNFNVNRATRVGYEVTGKSNFFNFNSSNSNITSFISVLPDKIAYKGQIKMNPLPDNGGNVSGYHDFAVYDKGIRLLANIDIPMKFRADYFELESWSDIEFSKNKALDGVNDGRFVVYATNGFPFTAQIQAYMYDENLHLIDSIFVPGQNKIDHGVLNTQNEVTAEAKSTVYIPVTKTKLDNLTRCKKIRIVSKLLMPPNPPDIGIFEKYEISINIIAEVNYNVSLTR